jgi:DNA-binding NarL/FixJ family response regulator
VTAEIRVLVAEDHALVREGVVSLLRGEPGIQVVAEAANGAQAVEAYRKHKPDVALLDLRMPHLNGAEVITQLRREFPDGRFIVLTTYDSEEDIFRAFEAGIEGYILKGASSAELLSAIRTVHEGGKAIPSDIAQRGLARAMAPRLTGRETELLELVVRGRSNAEIARELSVSEHTVKNHLVHIFSKLGVTARTQAAIMALQRGLVKL